MSRPGSRPGGGQGGGHDGLFEQFGSACPVCGARLGSPVPLDPRSGRFLTPPCFRLEIGPPDGDEHYTWRVTAIGPPGANYRPAVSQVPVFVEPEVEYVYLLCGDGHIFPESEPVNFRDRHGADTGQRVDRWNMVAAVGALASGKTYLLIRMMNQELSNPHNITPRGNQARVQRHQLNPLEQIPLDQRSKEYNKTLIDLKAIMPTQGEDTHPVLILGDMLPDAVAAIREIIRMTVVDGERRAEQWGRGFRQPLVVRTSSDRLLTWTGIADLPGELFDAGAGNVSERNKLRAYDALIWVIDPVVAEAALDKLTKDTLSEDADYNSVLDGSLRPGTLVLDEPARIRAQRARMQLDIGKSLTLIGNNYTINQGRALEMLIAVTKCDLIHAALRKGKHLQELGRPDSVWQGVAAYLASASRRWSARQLSVDEQTGKVMEYLQSAASAEDSVHRDRVYQVARGLLEHYSDEAAFWGLVHVGDRDRVNISGDGTMRLSNRQIEVASIGEHLDRSTMKGSGETMLVRDLVMSALGCGIAYGLGHQNAVFNVLQNDWQRIRLFLCSPLGTVPIARTGGVPGLAADYRLEPLGSGEQFPQMEDQSAALTQLLLAALRKARA